MATAGKPADPARQAQLMAELRRDQALRRQSYRDRALKLYPPLCARCGREFAGKRMKELTVHHKDHNHENNPPDGSNWELLCLYCHDHEHEKYKLKGYFDGSQADVSPQAAPLANPFSGLDSLLKSE